MLKLLSIAIGGALGSVLRYLVSGWGQILGDQVFPFGTLIVNIVGCFIMGFCGATLLGVYLMKEEYRIGIMIGVLGGFTTFSAYGWETLSMVHDGEMFRAVLNVIGNNVLALLAVWVGYRLGQSAFGV